MDAYQTTPCPHRPSGWRSLPLICPRTTCSSSSSFCRDTARAPPSRTMTASVSTSCLSRDTSARGTSWSMAHPARGSPYPFSLHSVLSRGSSQPTYPRRAHSLVKAAAAMTTTTTAKGSPGRLAIPCQSVPPTAALHTRVDRVCARARACADSCLAVAGETQLRRASS